MSDWRSKLKDTDMLPSKRAADFLGLGPRSLQNFRLKRDDGPPYYRFAANLVYYLVGDLRAWLASRRNPC